MAVNKYDKAIQILLRARHELEELTVEGLGRNGFDDSVDEVCEVMDRAIADFASERIRAWK